MLILLSIQIESNIVWKINDIIFNHNLLTVNEYFFQKNNMYLLKIKNS